MSGTLLSNNSTSLLVVPWHYSPPQSWTSLYSTHCLHSPHALTYSDIFSISWGRGVCCFRPSAISASISSTVRGTTVIHSMPLSVIAISSSILTYQCKHNINIQVQVSLCLKMDLSFKIRKLNIHLYCIATKALMK